MIQTMPSVDLAILTVLPEEYQAVQRKLAKYTSPTLSKPNIYAWILGEIPSKRFGRTYSVALGMTGRAGNVAGALATVEAINTWHPQCIFFVGIAGGFALDNINRGDVVLADVVYGYEYGKLERKFIPRYEQTFRCDQAMLNQGVQFATEQPVWVDEIGLQHPQQLASKVVRGNIASGDKVVDDPTNEFFAQIRQIGLKLHAVEMEGAGVAAAVEQARTLGTDARFLMMRGISDMPRPEAEAEIRGSQERDTWKAFASEAAAAFLMSFIAGGLDQAPREAVKERASEAELAKRISVFGLEDESGTDFGKSEFTEKLGFARDIFPLSPAPHYVILAAFPTGRLTATSADVLKAASNMLQSERWYSSNQGTNYPPKYWPHSIFQPPIDRRAARNAFVWEDGAQLRDSGFTISRLVITGTADVMFASALRFVDLLKNGTPVFWISKILAQCWRLSGLVAQLYHETDYADKTHLCIGMVNTLNSHLATFTDNWLEPYDPGYWIGADDWSCRSPNLKFCQELDLLNMKPKEQPEFIRRFAEEISLAYNHDTPRCLQKATGLIAEQYLNKD